MGLNFVAWIRAWPLSVFLCVRVCVCVCVCVFLSHLFLSVSLFLFLFLSLFLSLFLLLSSDGHELTRGFSGLDPERLSPQLLPAFALRGHHRHSYHHREVRKL